MFVGSANSPEELLTKLFNNCSALMESDQFELFLSQNFPQCTAQYFTRRRQHGTSWIIEPAALIILFTACEASTSRLNYLLVKLNPKPEENINTERIKPVLQEADGKSLLALLNWSAHEGLVKKHEIFQR